MLTVGTTLGPYKILAPLGAGGMGEVYCARDTRPGLHREVAIKVVRTDLARDPERHRRFELESRAAGALNHPNVCTIFDIGMHEGAPFVVMELLEGESLREKLRAGPLPLADAVGYSLQVSRALAAAHTKGIVHRDLKPENLFVTTDGRVKVLDFGLAKLLRPETPGGANDTTMSLAATESGAILGTAGYMSPEQLRGRAVDARSDLFAMGAVVYEMLSGSRAFKGESFIETASAILNDEPAALSSLRAEVSPALEALVKRCLEKEPAQRVQSAGELAAGLEAVASGKGVAVVAPVLGQETRHRLGHAWVAALATAVLVALGAIAVWQGWLPFNTRKPATPAEPFKILVAEFESAPSDSTTAMAARELLISALGQSQIVRTVSPEEIKLALKSTVKPGNTRLAGEVAREIAYRLAVRGVLEGKLGRLGSAYSIVLNLVDTDKGQTILTQSATAKDGNALITALGDLAKRLRAGLGESRDALRATRGMSLVMTPSFEAYQLYVQAKKSGREEMSDPKTISLYRAAVALDPDFASAWLAMNGSYQNLGHPDSALLCIKEALRRPERLWPRQRDDLALVRADLEGGDAAVVATYDRILAGDSTNLTALLHGSERLRSMGEFEEALARQQRLMRSQGSSPWEVTRMNLCENLMDLGRFDEAREAAGHMTGIWKQTHLVLVELQACRYAAAESIASAKPDDPRVEEQEPGNILGYLSTIRFARGALKASSADMARWTALASSGQREGRATESCKARLTDATFTGGLLPMPPDGWVRDTSITGWLWRGVRATYVGDVPLARRCLASIRNHPLPEQSQPGAGQALLEARIAILQRNPREAIRILQPLSSLRVDHGKLECGLTWVRWTIADALERAGQPDSAAVHLERIFSPARADTYLWPSVHYRLALLYARLGRIPETERHIAALEKAWDRPDPEVFRMLDQAHAALAAAKHEPHTEASWR